MIVTHPKKRVISIGPDKRPFDLAVIYACVDGRVKIAFTEALHAGGRIDALAPDRIAVVDSYERGTQIVPYHRTFYWHEKAQTYTSDPVVAPPPPRRSNIPCRSLESVDATRLIALPSDGPYTFSHGFGLYDDGEFEVTLDSNRMVGQRQRMIVIKKDHLKGAGVLMDVLAFACVSGRVENVFGQGFDEGVNAGPRDGKFAVASPAWSQKDKAYTEVMWATYAWHPELGDYVLTNLDLRPLRSWNLFRPQR